MFNCNNIHKPIYVGVSLHSFLLVVVVIVSWRACTSFLHLFRRLRSDHTCKLTPYLHFVSYLAASPPEVGLGGLAEGAPSRAQDRDAQSAHCEVSHASRRLRCLRIQTARPLTFVTVALVGRSTHGHRRASSRTSWISLRGRFSPCCLSATTVLATTWLAMIVLEGLMQWI